MTFTTDQGITLTVFRGPRLDWGLSIHLDDTLLFWQPEVLPFDQWGFDSVDTFGIPFFGLRPWSQARWRGELQRHYHRLLKRFLEDVSRFDRIKHGGDA